VPHDLLHAFQVPCSEDPVPVLGDENRYIASFVVETEAGPLPETESVVGIDLGLTHFAVLSDGRKIASPKFLRRAERTLRRRQQDLSRKAKGSRNRDKARIKVARAHARAADARRDFHHQISTALIRDNQAVAVENLAVKALGRTKMAKSVHDAGWASFVNMLEYKAALYGRQFHRIGRFEPTSQTCCLCGVKDGPKPLHIRTWRCQCCGACARIYGIEPGAPDREGGSRTRLSGPSTRWASRDTREAHSPGRTAFGSPGRYPCRIREGTRPRRAR
jgi:putative transposase